MKKILLALLFLPFYINAQIITTVVGNGFAGYYGDGGLATAAEVYNPGYCTFDDSGNLYIADMNMHLIRKVNKSGVITTYAGSYLVSFGAGGYGGDDGPATLAKFNYPHGIAFDHSGNLYIADQQNFRIRKVNASGIVTTYAGTGVSGFSGDSGPATAAKLHNIWGLAVDEIGNLYFADVSDRRVRKVSTSGIITTVAGNGTYGHTGDGGPATDATLSWPIDVATDRQGNLYIADELNDCVRKVDVSGIITAFAGNGIVGFAGDGGPATAAQMHWPAGLGIDKSNGERAGSVYISDYGNNMIREVSTSGTIRTIAGIGTPGYNGDGILATSAELFGPYGSAVDSFGRVYIADAGNNRVRRVGPGQPTYAQSDIRVSIIADIYPNPATSMLTINSRDKITNVFITNILGQTLYTQSYSAEQVQVNVEALPPGMYLIKVAYWPDGATITRKFIKQ